MKISNHPHQILQSSTDQIRQPSPNPTMGSSVFAYSALAPAFAFFVPVLSGLSSP